MNPEWRDSALCAQTDPDMFFPDKGMSSRDAKKICGGCPVSFDCLEYALAHHPLAGVWGNTTERERRNMNRGAA